MTKETKEEKKSSEETEKKEDANVKKTTGKEAASSVAKSVYGDKRNKERQKRMKRGKREKQDEFDQRVVDLARVTRVMAGGKRMRFRACVAIGDKKGKVGIGLDKGADVSIAITKAVNKAKKAIIEVPIVNNTIPHEISQKTGAARILLRPARKGRGVIAGGAARIILELAGVKNVTSKIFGASNKVSVARNTIDALNNLKKIEPKVKKTNEKKEGSKTNEKKEKNK